MRHLYFLFIVISLFSSCALAVHRADRLFNEASLKKLCYDAIIVPGVPLRNGEWDSVMKARVLWSVYLYQNNFTKNIIYSGAAVYTPFYEAIAMGLYAKQLGVPGEHIFYDTLAQHSTENIYYSYKLARTKHFKTIALATDPFQSALLKRFTRKRFGTPIQHIPIQFEIIQKINTGKININSMKSFKQNFQAITERESMRSRLKGTLGRQIYYGPDKRLRPL